MKRKESDKYDEAIAYLTSHPDQLENAWYNPTTTRGGCLFLYCTNTGRAKHRTDGKYCGCLTQVKAHCTEAWTDNLTEKIRKDEDLPHNLCEINLTDLKTFAKWQRHMDRTIRRKR